MDINKFIQMGLVNTEPSFSFHESYLELLSVSNTPLAFGEGLFDTKAGGGSNGIRFGDITKGIGKGVSAAGRAGRDAVQFAHRAATKLLEMLKAVIANFGEMVQKMILQLGDKTKELENILPKIESSKSNINNIVKGMSNNSKATAKSEADESKVPTFIDKLEDKSSPRSELTKRSGDTEKGPSETYEIYTTYSFNMAGWDIRNERSPIGNFLEIVGNTQDNGFDLSNITNEKELYDFLQNSFEIAFNIYDKHPLFKRFSIINKYHKSLTTTLRSALTRPKYTYSFMTAESYGQYVAQTVSPAGAFIIQNNESYAQGKERERGTAEFLTPKLVRDVPIEAVPSELLKSFQYTGIIIRLLNDVKIMEHLNSKLKFINGLKRDFAAMSRLTTAELNKLKSNALYRSKVNGTEGSVSSMSYADTLVDQKTSAQSFIPEDVLKELLPYGEDDFIKPSTNMTGALNTARQELNDTNADLKTFTAIKDNKLNAFNSVEKQKARIKTEHLTIKTIDWGVKYMYQLLVSMGNYTFQEGKFYNKFTEILLKVVNELLEQSKRFTEDISNSDKYDLDLDNNDEKFFSFNDTQQKQIGDNNSNNAPKEDGKNG